jgi:hypothetical protein
MSKVCYKKGPGNTFYELDIYSDMNMAIDKDCPDSWSEGSAPVECQEGANKMMCYKCNNNMRQVTTNCIPEGADVIAECGKGYDNYPIKCNYPSLDDLQPYNPKVYDVRYCPCQEADGTVTGYSPMCCPQTAGVGSPSSYSPTPNYNPNLVGARPVNQPVTAIGPVQPVTAGVTKLPWFAWLLAAGGLIYFFKVQDKKMQKNK